ncbi:MAG TPA: hypothetical protein VFQ47_06145 [Nitrososphaera sp.]|nr:hypothetical protein [Nitrososphaera sp.]
MIFIENLNDFGVVSAPGQFCVRQLLDWKPMKLQFFGDSYDIIKKSLISWLGEFGSRSAHPMFTEPTTLAQAALFARFLDAHLISTETLAPSTDRAAYFMPCRSAGNLFLDPDTGVRLKPRRGLKSVNYIFGSELVALSQARPTSLTLVFDQSFSRGSQMPHIQEKLEFFASHGVYGFAYSSHAPFLILSSDSELAVCAHGRLLEVSGLPASRLVMLGAA